MFGYGNGWAVLLYGMVLLWIPLGPCVMAGLGVASARRPSRLRTAARILSAAVPVVAVGAPAAVLFNLFNPTGAPPNQQDIIGFTCVYFLALTVARGCSPTRSRASSEHDAECQRTSRPGASFPGH
ncbi:hypothetical protein JHN61_04620 [Streptomyces sp. MBT67]|uniref:hypothetical protein n=1 Tax=unclassified Streptomyces TaxID=2593676 RepID=UPI00190922E7|nr:MULTISPECIES: hypothetical protein [unclassified Streptomyces]MBK3531082.1 hypothetical protein [Streptomyces sp. MBT72]MBK3535513.1 hypothetical protein [Streptomyces sp. MBT67]MBK3552448.1 hypothetical protein [Streptomyces sp. MBT61]MBK6030559.1 hypothetical protein [Streptomyces sp. MBT59]